MPFLGEITAENSLELELPASNHSGLDASLEPPMHPLDFKTMCSELCSLRPAEWVRNVMAMALRIGRFRTVAWARVRAADHEASVWPCWSCLH